MGTILISPNTETIEGPIIYLAGPINGAPDWQSDAIGHLCVNPSVHIVSPRQARDASTLLSEEDSKVQIEWEQVYMESAVKDGVVLFWFAKPLSSVSTSYYAQQSFFELGDILANVGKRHSVCVGIEGEFPNAEYLTATLTWRYPELTIHKTLSDVCDEALRIIRTQYI